MNPKRKAVLRVEDIVTRIEGLPKNLSKYLVGIAILWWFRPRKDKNGYSRPLKKSLAIRYREMTYPYYRLQNDNETIRLFLISEPGNAKLLVALGRKDRFLAAAQAIRNARRLRKAP